MTTRDRTRDRGAAELRFVFMAAVIVALIIALGATILRDDGDTAGSPSSVTQATGAPDAAGTLVDEGLQLHVEGDLDGAAARYRAAIALDAASKLAHYNLGLIHQLQGRAKDAEREYRITIDLDDRYAPALYNLGVLLAADGDVDGAIALYERAIDADDSFATAHFNLGLLLLAEGDEKGGNAAIARALELDPRLQERLQADG